MEFATIAGDLKYSFRKLAATPGITAAAVLCLALGVGANTTVFTFVDGLFFRPLGVEGSTRLVQLFTTDSRLGEVGGFGNLLPVSRLTYEDLRLESRAFSGVAAFQSIFLSWTKDGRSVRIPAEVVGGPYFETLGVEMERGRGFLPQENQPEAGVPVVVVSHGFWQRELGADPGVLDRTLILNNQEFHIVGVAPARFEGTAPLSTPEVWVPYSMHKRVLVGRMADYFEDRRALSFNVVARLAPGVTVSEARASLHGLASEFERRYPTANQDRSLELARLEEANIPAHWREIFSQASVLLLVISGLVLLIACSNVANLLLVKTLKRESEIAVRLTLGGRRRDLIRQLFIEGAMVAAMGGLLSLAVAQWGARKLWAYRPAELAQATMKIGLNPRLFLFTFLVAALAAVGFTVAPAVRAMSQDIAVAMKGERMQAGARRFRLSFSEFLVGVQVALSVVALLGAGLFVMSLHEAQRIDPLFDAERLAVVTFDLASQGYDLDTAENFYRQLLERVEALPGVADAAVGSHLLLSLEGAALRSAQVEGADPRSAQGTVLAGVSMVSSDYFDTLGLELLEGRKLNSGDRQGGQLVAVVSQTMSERIAQGRSVVGQQFRLSRIGQPIQVVGVVRDSRYVRLTEEPQPYFYLPLEQQPPNGVVSLFVRSGGTPEDLLGELRATFRSLDPAVPLIHLWAYGDVIDRSLATSHLAATLLGGFGLLALLLTGIGMYGMVAHAVNERRREIAMRIALGASRWRVIRGALNRVGVPLTAGVAVGGGVSYALFRAASSLLFGVSSTEPATYLIVGAAMILTGAVAALIPAMKALGYEPMSILKGG